MICDAWKWFFDSFEEVDVSFEDFEFFAAVFEDALKDVPKEIFFEIHQLIEFHEWDFRFDHPEFCEVAASL